MKKYFLLLLLLVSGITGVHAYRMRSSVTGARTVSLCGHVKDAFTKCGIEDVRITLMKADSTIVDTMTVKYHDEGKTYMDSYYVFQVPATPGKYIIRAEHEGYETTFVNYEITHIARNTEFDVPLHLMKRVKKTEPKDGGALGEVVVKATKLKIVNRGDTIVYNADAFNLSEGSMLDDLVRQMPNVTLNKSGEIFLNGRKVDYLLLNGKNFFKGKNNVMLENLASYMVNKIKFYDKQTDKDKYVGINVERKDFVMDVNLKREYAKGYLANVDAGAGTNGRYMARAFAARMTAQSRFSIYGNVNNVNEYRSPGSDGDWRSTNVNDGELKSKTVGMDLNIDDKKGRFSENLYANVSWQDMFSDVKTMKQSFLDTGQSFNLNRSISRPNGIFAYASNEFTLYKPLLVKIGNSIQYINSDGHSEVLSATFSENPNRFGDPYKKLDSIFSATPGTSKADTLVNKYRQDVRGSGHRMTAVMDVSAVKKLPWGDVLEVNASASKSDSPNTTHDLYNLAYLQGSSEEKDNRNKYTKDSSHSYEYSLGAKYGMHFLNKWNIELSYKYAQDYSWQTKSLYRLDWLGNGYADDFTGTLPSTRDSLLMALDYGNSYHSGLFERSHHEAAKVYYDKSYDDKSLRIEINLPFENKYERLNYYKTGADTCLHRRMWLFRPDVTLDFRTNNNKLRYYFNYSLQVAPPGLMRMVNVRDDSNPLAVSIGNPSLKNTVSHHFDLSFSKQFASMQRFLNVDWSTSIIDRSVANSFVYNPANGVYTYQPKNVSGNWFTSVSFGFSSALDKQRRLDYEINTRYYYNHNVDLIRVSSQNTSSRSVVNNHVLSQNLKLNYQLGNFRCGIAGQLEYNNSTSKSENFTTINAYDFSYGLTSGYMFPWDINFYTDIKMYSRRGYDNSAMDTDNLIWNISLSRSFLKGRLVAKVDGFDVLKQLSNYSYVVNGQGRTETIRNSVPGYLMLHLLYKINIKPR
jgi:hypothetical protein